MILFEGAVVHDCLSSRKPPGLANWTVQWRQKVNARNPFRHQCEHYSVKVAASECFRTQRGLPRGLSFGEGSFQRQDLRLKQLPAKEARESSSSSGASLRSRVSVIAHGGFQRHETLSEIHLAVHLDITASHYISIRDLLLLSTSQIFHHLRRLSTSSSSC